MVNPVRARRKSRGLVSEPRRISRLGGWR